MAASNIFEEALAMAAEKKKLHTLPNIYVHFSRLKYMVSKPVVSLVCVHNKITKYEEGKKKTKEKVEWKKVKIQIENFQLVDTCKFVSEFGELIKNAAKQILFKSYLVIKPYSFAV